MSRNDKETETSSGHRRGKQLRPILLVKLAGLAACLWLALSQIDFHKALLHFKQSNQSLLIIALAFSIMGTLGLMVIRRRIILLLADISYIGVVKAFFTAHFFAVLAPARIGSFLAEPLALNAYSHGQVKINQGLAVSLGINILHNIRRTLLAIIGTIAYHGILTGKHQTLLVIAIGIYTAFTTLLLTAILLTNSLRRLAEHLAQRSRLFGFLLRVSEVVVMAKKSLITLVTHRLALPYGLSITLANFALETTRLWIIMSAFDVHLPFLGLVFFSSLAYSVTVVPVTFGGIGLVEISGMWYLEAFGAVPETALAIVFIDRLFSVYLYSLAGSVFPWLTGKRLPPPVQNP